jgi:hypothetical protein
MQTTKWNCIVPKIRTAYSSVFPDGTTVHKFINPDVTNDTRDSKYLRQTETEEQIQMFQQWTQMLTGANAKENLDKVFKEYKEKWHDKKYGSRYFDLHGVHFQEFALNLTNLMDQPSWRKLSISKSHANRRILRGRVYGIGSRDNIDWNGQLITDEEQIQQKREELLDHMKSLQLYDWYAPNATPDPLPTTDQPQDLTIRIMRQGTQETVQQVHEEMGDEKQLIAWLNFAAGHNTCGAYSCAWGGSQEEEVATNCDGAVVLGTMGHFVDTGVKAFIRKGIWVSYNEGMHIPPGGNYFCKTKFVTGPQHVECVMIATAFCDLRYYTPFFTPYVERNYFYKYFGYGGLINEEELEQRLIIDIEGVLKTCIAQNVHTLVTGASGCGAFLHDPYVEAKLWRKCLDKEEYRSGSLKQVIFAVLDKEESANWKAFAKEFA